jgi:hypothetical protein
MASEANPEQTLADIEKIFEDSKAARLFARYAFEAAKGHLHMQLVAKREAGAILTVSDIKALEACAINDVPEVREAYLEFVAADSKYRASKVTYEAAVREYWDSRKR